MVRELAAPSHGFGVTWISTDIGHSGKHLGARVACRGHSARRRDEARLATVNQTLPLAAEAEPMEVVKTESRKSRDSVTCTFLQATENEELII